MDKKMTTCPAGNRLSTLQHHLSASATAASSSSSSSSSPQQQQQQQKPKANYSAFRISKELEAAIPGPWDLADPVTGHMKSLEETFGIGHAHLTMKEWRDKYGPLYGYYSYEQTNKVVLLRVVLSDPAEVRRFLKLNPPKPKGYEQSIILGEGVLSNSNPREWARQRELLKPAFTTEALKDLFPVVKSGAAILSRDLNGYCCKNEEIDMHEVLSAYAFLIIGHSALGEEDGFLDRSAKALRGSFTTAAIQELNRTDVHNISAYQEARTQIKDFTRETIQRHEVGQRESEAQGCPFKNPHSLISIISGKDKEGKPFFSEKQKSDQLSTFMFAGYVFFFLIFSSVSSSTKTSPV